MCCRFWAKIRSNPFARRLSSQENSTPGGKGNPSPSCIHTTEQSTWVRINALIDVFTDFFPSVCVLDVKVVVLNVSRSAHSQSWCVDVCKANCSFLDHVRRGESSGSDILSNFTGQHRVHSKHGLDDHLCMEIPQRVIRDWNHKKTLNLFGFLMNTSKHYCMCHSLFWKSDVLETNLYQMWVWVQFSVAMSLSKTLHSTI